MNNKKIDKDEFEEGLSCVAEDQYNQGYNDARTQQKADVVKLIDAQIEELEKLLKYYKKREDFKINQRIVINSKDELKQLKSKVKEMK